MLKLGLGPGSPGPTTTRNASSNIFESCRRPAAPPTCPPSALLLLSPPPSCALFAGSTRAAARCRFSYCFPSVCVRLSGSRVADRGSDSGVGGGDYEHVLHSDDVGKHCDIAPSARLGGRCRLMLTANVRVPGRQPSRGLPHLARARSMLSRVGGPFRHPPAHRVQAWPSLLCRSPSSLVEPIGEASDSLRPVSSYVACADWPKCAAFVVDIVELIPKACLVYCIRLFPASTPNMCDMFSPHASFGLVCRLACDRPSPLAARAPPTWT